MCLLSREITGDQNAPNVTGTTHKIRSKFRSMIVPAYIYDTPGDPSSPRWLTMTAKNLSEISAKEIKPTYQLNSEQTYFWVAWDALISLQEESKDFSFL